MKPVGMKYDRLGFPIPPEFDVPASTLDVPSSAFDVPSPTFAAERPAPGFGGPDFPGSDFSGGAGRQRAPGTWKRRVILLLLAAAVLPALLVPAALPAIREVVVEWSLERAVRREARGQIPAAIVEVDRAIQWSDADERLLARLLCWRALLRIENRDAAGAAADAGRAVALDPMGTQPRRVRALAHVVLEDAEAALADAEAAVEISGRRNPDALNHRAYIRALVGRDLDAGLADIEVALAAEEESPEYLDTRGYLLHLLGRHQEAIDDLNRAIDESHRRRRRTALLAGRADPAEIARQLRSIDHGLAVMHHHRGLACRAAGLEQQARQDLDIAERKGFDPSRGIF
jgi:tetratricopeptide (TPR) repeat protein